MIDVNESANNLKEYGITVLENALPIEYVERCKKTIVDYFENKDNLSKPYGSRLGGQKVKADGFNYEGLEICSEVVENKLVISVLNEVLDNNIRWLHHSDVHINFVGAKSFHDDRQDRLWPSKEKCGISTMDKDYEVYRLGTYLTESNKKEAPFFVKPKSHTTRYTGINHDEEYEVNAGKGDIVIFHSALLHKGGDMFEDRVSMFWAFGRDNLHSEYHSMAAIKRQMNQNQSEYTMSKILSNRLNKCNISYEINEKELQQFMKLSKDSASY